MRFDSSASNSPTSRNVSTCASGMTSRCTGACGWMSLIAAKPSALCTNCPSRASEQNKQSSRCCGTDPLLGHRFGADTDDLADRGVDEPRSVVVAVAAAGAVDEHHVALLRSPALEAQLVRQRAQARTTLLLHGRRD